MLDLTAVFQKAIQGDRQAIVSLIETHRSRLIHDLQGSIDPRLASRVSLSDVLQEMCLQQLNLQDDLDGSEDLKGVRSIQGLPESSRGAYRWIRRLTKNRIIDQHRKHMASSRDARREVSFRDPSSSVVRIDRLVAVDINPPSAPLREEEQRQRLRQLVEHLDPIYRDVIKLKVFGDLSTEEVAMALGITKMAVSKRYIRGLAQLRQISDVKALL